jgi:3-oxoacyl-[acyl-carrier-protein] synthase-3
MNIGSKILAFGKALPKKVVTNFDLESLMDTSDDWITQRTGIKERRVADESIGENSTTLAAAAAKSCFEQAKKLNPEFELTLENASRKRTKIEAGKLIKTIQDMNLSVSANANA